MTARWRLSGEFVVSCNCDVFCPCMMSLGKSRPTNPPCLSCFGYHVEDGEVEGQPVRGLNVVQMLEVPGRMEEGSIPHSLRAGLPAAPPARLPVVPFVNTAR